MLGVLGCGCGLVVPRSEDFFTIALSGGLREQTLEYSVEAIKVAGVGSVGTVKKRGGKKTQSP